MFSTLVDKTDDKFYLVYVAKLGWQGGHFCGKLPMPASSRMDTPLAKAEPVTGGGRASGIMYLRRKKELWHRSSSGQRKVRICKWHQEYGANKPGQWRRGRRWSWYCSRVCPTAHGEAAMPCSPWRSTGEQGSTCSPWRSPQQNRQMPRGGCDPLGDPHWNSLFLQDCTP